MNVLASPSHIAPLESAILELRSLLEPHDNDPFGLSKATKGMKRVFEEAVPFEHGARRALVGHLENGSASAAIGVAEEILGYLRSLAPTNTADTRAAAPTGK